MDAMSSVKVCFNAYYFAENDKELGKSLSIPKYKNLDLIKESSLFSEIKTGVKENIKTKCYYEDSKSNVGKIDLYFNNYTGYFYYYKENDEKEWVLAIDKKFCEFIGLCDVKDCNKCFVDDNTDFLDKAKADQVVRNYNEYFSKFLNKILENGILGFDSIIDILSLTRFYGKKVRFTNNDLFRILVLLKYKNHIEGWFRQIFANPHEDNKEEETYKPIAYADTIDSDILTDIVTNTKYLVKNNKRILLNLDYIPMYVLQRKKIRNFDTPENRFLKFFLDQVISFLQRQEALFSNRVDEKSVITNLKQSFLHIRNNSFFKEIKDMKYIIPLYSQVLMKRAGYKDIFHVYSLLGFDFKPEPEDEFDFLRLKSMDILYEYFVLSIIVKAIRGLGYEIKNGEFQPGAGFDFIELTFEKGKEHIVLKYQYEGEYKLRPDFLVEYKNEERNKNIIFDAKFMKADNVPTDSDQGLKKYFGFKPNSNNYGNNYTISQVHAICMRKNAKHDNNEKKFYLTATNKDRRFNIFKSDYERFEDLFRYIISDVYKEDNNKIFGCIEVDIVKILGEKES